MTWDIAVAGTVTLDDVTTPHGRRVEQPGGSAVYFALAASHFAPVVVSGVVGVDAETSIRQLATRGVRLDGLIVSQSPTFRWRAVHDYEHWVTASETSVEGAYAEWRPRLPATAVKAEVLFAGSMRPELQAEVMRQSEAKLIGVDSMRGFIARQRADVRAVVDGADVLFLDRTELGQLTGSSPAAWLEAARSLCRGGRLRAVVVKGGPLGAACVTSSEVAERPATPVATVMDPTGAGDSLAGGFLGACAQAERDDAGFWPAALEAGLSCAASAIGAFGAEGLR